MQNTSKFNALNVAETIHKHSKDSQFLQLHFEPIREELDFFSEFCGLREIPAILFANMLIMEFEECKFTPIFEHLGFEKHDIIRYKREVSRLMQSGLIKIRHGGLLGNRSYAISDEILYHFSENRPLEKRDEEKESLTDVLEEFSRLSEFLSDELMTPMEFMGKLRVLTRENVHIPLLEEIENNFIPPQESYILFTALNDAVEAGDNDYQTNLYMALSELWEKPAQATRELNRFSKGNSSLIQDDYLELSKDTFRNQIKVRLAPRLTDYLREKEEILIDTSETKKSALILHDEIRKKELFFNSDEREQMKTVENMMEEESFNLLLEKLDEKNMPLGLTLLFYGKPGTGKTEYVYQLAKATGRNIFKVEIAETKSMWFGESQKLTRQIFRDYENFKKNEKRCPILLFNEADAIIGKRKSSDSHPLSNTENSIQNILLEQMEAFDGILVATTNLHSNLDEAFERRFLYKIKFETPDAEIAMHIWKTLLPFLRFKDCKELALEFGFSGGEIQNIAKKSLMQELLHHKIPNLEMIRDLCRREKWTEGNENSKVGFRA